MKKKSKSHADPKGRFLKQKNPLHIESINDEKWALATDSGVVVDVYYSANKAQAALDSYNKNKKQ